MRYAPRLSPALNRIFVSSFARAKPALCASARVCNTLRLESLCAARVHWTGRGVSKHLHQHAQRIGAHSHALAFAPCNRVWHLRLLASIFNFRRFSFALPPGCEFKQYCVFHVSLR
jgi:hypothetical protein